MAAAPSGRYRSPDSASERRKSAIPPGCPGSRSPKPRSALLRTPVHLEVRPRQHRLTLPILAVGGAAAGETMTSVADAGHYPAEECPGGFLTVVLPFLLAGI